jgi:phage repressor protein C with HTH and peptisase S24 domain
MDLRRRIAWAINNIQSEVKISDALLGQKLGINKNTVIAYRKGAASIKSSALEGLVKHYNYSSKWILEGMGEPFPGAREKYPEVCGPDELFIEENEQSDFVYIPQINGRISAGNGLVPEPTIKTQIAFRRDWITRKGKPEYMLLIKVSGDSMEPTLLSGDLVLIDRSRNYFDPQGGIYAIAIDDVIMIKRLQAEYPAKKVKIISDNSKYSITEADADQVKIKGKVIWFGRELER